MNRQLSVTICIGLHLFFIHRHEKNKKNTTKKPGQCVKMNGTAVNISMWGEKGEALNKVQNVVQQFPLPPPPPPTSNWSSENPEVTWNIQDW